MKINKYYKSTLIALTGLFLIITSGCEQAQVSSGNINPYRKDEVVSMLSYHGTLVARFDGKRWLVLIGKKWMPIENGLTHKLASISSSKKKL